MVGFEGASASAPMESDCASSKIGVQVAPPFNVLHTPPCAVPRYTLLEFVGSTTTHVARPLTGVMAGYCCVWPFGTGEGPMGIHAGSPGSPGTPIRATIWC